VVTAKTKVADEYDRKEKNMAVELRMCVGRGVWSVRARAHAHVPLPTCT